MIATHFAMCNSLEQIEVLARATSRHHSEIEQWDIERRQLIDAADARARDRY